MRKNLDTTQAFGKLPIYFIENQGQIDSDDVAFYVKGADKTLYFTKDGITFSLHGEDERWTVKLDFVEANQDVVPQGENKQEAIFSYFKGRPEDWKAGCLTYEKVVYEDLWPGIDLIYSGSVNELKYEFVVEPGAEPRQIRLAYQSATEVRINEGGELVVSTPVAEFEDATPYAYQEIDGERVEIGMAYCLLEDSKSGAWEYGFEIGNYDRTVPLVLDPAMLVYCGYIGGVGNDDTYGIAVDDAGCAYIVGYSESTEFSFPVAVGPDLMYNGGYYDAFVAKVDPQGTALEYCGYIGGGDDDGAEAIAVDASGCAYVAGWTASTESSFPKNVGPDLTFNGYYDAFVAKVNPQGTALEYCGYIGGIDDDDACGIAIDASGCAYVAGYSRSTELSFPVAIGPDLTFNGASDAFVAKVDPQGTALEYCGYIGGDDFESARAIAVNDASGHAFVAGSTWSTEFSFPVAIGPDLTFNGGDFDAFVAKVDPQGTALEYCGYIGGDDEDSATGIDVDDDCAYVAGYSRSTEFSFPVTAGPDLTYNGGEYDAFVAKVDPQGAALEYCGYIGGGDEDDASSIAVDDAGCAYVAGGGYSTESSFPVNVGPDLTYNSGYYGNDGFVAKVHPQGTGLDYCGYIGGYFSDFVYSIALHTDGSVFVAGVTTSRASSFPVAIGPDLTSNGLWDAFVAKLPPYHVLLRAGNVCTGAVNPKDVLFINGSSGDDCYRTIINPPGSPVSIAMKAPPGGPNPTAFALYAWPGEAGPSDVAIQPYNIGTACFPMPLSNGVPWPPPITVANNIGYPSMLGNPMLPNVSQAPTYIVKNRILNPGTWTFQGIIYDNNSDVGPVSLTNAIVLVQQ